MSTWRLENPFSAKADANIASLFNSLEKEFLNTATTHPLEDCSSRVLQLTKTSGVGASRGAVGVGLYSTDVLDVDATLELNLRNLFAILHDMQDEYVLLTLVRNGWRNRGEWRAA